MSDQRSEAAKKFADEWQGRGYEKGETHAFWLSLLHQVYGVENPEKYIRFETQVKIDTTSFIDAYIADTSVMIEQKSIGKNLNQPIRQSDGSLLTPFQQAKRYIGGLPRSEHPRWLVTCNFAEFWVYDMEQPNNEPEKILLADLYDETTMPPELRRAHQENDRAIMAAYGWSKSHPAYSSESTCVAELMKMYQSLVSPS